MTKESINKGKQLRFAREYRGYLSVFEFAKKAEISPSRLSRFERGFKTYSLTNKEIERAMKFLDFPTEFLDANIANPKII